MPMRDEIKLSLKDARERDDDFAEDDLSSEAALYDERPECWCSEETLDGATHREWHPDCPVHGPRKGQMLHWHKPGWHRAPDLAMLKSRPVDPPRERDIEALRKAALRPPAAWCDWNGPSSDPCLKYAGIGGGGHASPPASGSGNLPDAAPAPAPVADSAVGEWPKWYRYDRLGLVTRFDGPSTGRTWRNDGNFWDWFTVDAISERVRITESEALAWLESHGHAQVAAEMRAKATSVLPVAPELGEFEPVEMVPQPGDVARLLCQGAGSDAKYVVTEHGNCHLFQDNLGRRFYLFEEHFANGRWRLLKRKNVAARAWKAKPDAESNVFVWLLLDGSFYTFGQRHAAAKWNHEKHGGTSAECLSAHDMFSEIHDPAEIQRLVRELHAAGLGK